MILNKKYNFKSSKLLIIQRLIREWNEEEKLIIAIDFDDTIHPYTQKFENEDYQERINFLKDCKTLGAYLVLWTASSSERYPLIWDYCKKHGIEIDSINTNPIPLNYGNNGKIFANIYIDDRAGIDESLEILYTAYLARLNYLNLNSD